MCTRVNILRCFTSKTRLLWHSCSMHLTLQICASAPSPPNSYVDNFCGGGFWIFMNFTCKSISICLSALCLQGLRVWGWSACVVSKSSLARLFRWGSVQIQTAELLVPYINKTKPLGLMSKLKKACICKSLVLVEAWGSCLIAVRENVGQNSWQK